MRYGWPLLLLIAGCSPNPRNEIPPIAEAALAHAVAETRSHGLCVERVITPWQPAVDARRIDTPAPPGLEALRGPDVFRGGGALKGDRVGGVAVRGGPECLRIHGPLVAGDKAMIELHLVPTGWNIWLRKTAGDWRVVMTTSSVYPD